MKTIRVWLSGGLVMLVLVGLVLVGCETTESTDNVITVSPASATLTNDWATVVFTASFSSTNVALALPLRWSVSDPAHGNIRAVGGMMAVYEANNRGGFNTITVRDQGDNEGAAVVIRN